MVVQKAVAVLKGDASVTGTVHFEQTVSFCIVYFGKQSVTTLFVSRIMDQSK